MSWRILCYHGIAPSLRQSFGRQLDGFLRDGWEFCSFSEGLKSLEQNHASNGRKLLTVSFDDGERTVCDVAQPELDARGIQAILYLSTDYVDQGRTYQNASSLPAASWGQLKQWLAAGHEIGSHTHTHVDLSKCLADQATEEMSLSRIRIQQELGMIPEHLAYPFGRYSESLVTQVRDSTEWRTAATVERGWNRAGVPPHRLRRDLIWPEWSTAKIRLHMSWVGRTIHALKRRIQGP